MNKKIQDIQHVYNVGFAITAFGTGKLPNLNIPFISIQDIFPQAKVGEDLLNTHIEGNNTTILLFHNLEGLAVLEKMIEYVKKELENER